MVGPAKGEQEIDADAGEGRSEVGGRFCGGMGDAGGRGNKVRRPPPFMMLMPLLILVNLCALFMMIRKVDAVHRALTDREFHG